MKACGNVFKYGNNVDTDVIIPARYLNATKGEELAKHCMEDIDKKEVSNVGISDDEDLLMREVICGDADLCFLHHYLSEVFRKGDNF